MNDKTKMLLGEFLHFLGEEHSYLIKIKLFLAKIPTLIPSGEITQMEFQNFLETYELETSKFLYERNQYRDRIAQALGLKPDQISFQLLVNMGHSQFKEKGRRILKITNEINMLLIKVSVFLKNFRKLQGEFNRLNSFLHQKDYSARGTEPVYNPGRNFHMEA